MRYDPPRLLPVGDAALLVEFGDEIDEALNLPVHALSASLASDPAPGIGEAVPTYRSLLLHYDPLLLTYDEAAAAVQDALARETDRVLRKPRLVEVPTCYGGEHGPDLAQVAAHTGLPPEEVVRLHSSAVYRVYMLGFIAGFAYLGGLPPALVTPRLTTPRTEVPAGSVGIGGEQTGAYPIVSPGGWQIIGRTPVRLFDPNRASPTLMLPGDRVRFVPLPREEFSQRQSEAWGPPGHGNSVTVPGSRPGFQVLQPGPLTSVQDLGRNGYEKLGVPVSGAMDAIALRAANLLVGNPPGAAALEVTAGGLVLRALTDCLIATAGADMGLTVNGLSLPNGMSAFVRRGWVVELPQRRTGFRAYLAVAGGIAVPLVMGSSSTYLQGEFGGLAGRALRAGDVLSLTPTAGHLPDQAGRCLPAELLPRYSDSPTVDVILGPQEDAFTVEGVQAFLSGGYTVGVVSNRMGYRLAGPTIAHRSSANIVSDGIARGAVQVPADRQPIVMMADRQTTGGYTKIAVVASADLPLLAQCVPGASRVRFRATDVASAQARYRRLLRSLQEWTP